MRQTDRCSEWLVPEKRNSSGRVASMTLGDRCHHSRHGVVLPATSAGSRPIGIPFRLVRDLVPVPRYCHVLCFEFSSRYCEQFSFLVTRPPLFSLKSRGCDVNRSLPSSRPELTFPFLFFFRFEILTRKVQNTRTLYAAGNIPNLMPVTEPYASGRPCSRAISLRPNDRCVSTSARPTARI